MVQHTHTSWLFWLTEATLWKAFKHHECLSNNTPAMCRILHRSLFGQRGYIFLRTLLESPGCVCTHPGNVSNQRNWPTVLQTLPCVVQGRGLTVEEENTFYRSFLCSSHKIATFWRKDFIWKEFAAWRGNQNWYVGQSAFLPQPSRSNCLWGESRGKEIDRFLQIPQASWQNQDGFQNGLKNMDRESKL